MGTLVVGVAGGKGGVGKSTVALGLALALRDRGDRVGLLDADLYGPDIPRMLGLTRTAEARSIMLAERPDPGRRRPTPVKSHGLAVWSTQFLVAEHQGLALQSPLASLLLKRAFSTVDWGELDWLVVDMPPGTADVQQEIGRLGLHGAVLVVTPQDVAHLDAKKVHDMFVRGGVPIIGGIENMSSMSCPCCGTALDLFSPTPWERTIWAAGVDQIATVGWSDVVRRAAGSGRPDDEPSLGSLFADAATRVAERLPA